MDYTKIKDERIRGIICDLMSEMLDNPDKSGIYPTSKFMSKMEDFVIEERQFIVGKTYAQACILADRGRDLRKYPFPKFAEEILNKEN